MTAGDPQTALKDFRRKNDFFVGIDSDGCAFDTMEIKHKECFIPNIIKHWDLQAVSKYAREGAEFVNLYSKWRGINRFPALLADREEVRRRGVTMPEVPSLRKWVESESKLGNPGLKAAVKKTGDAVLERTLVWSEAVNAAVADMVHGVPPFPYVRDSLDALAPKADIIVVSATPGEALRREWQEHDIAKYSAVIAGQEMGSKREHLQLAAAGKYEKDHALMIGDAPGDLKAAQANGFLFYPIEPGGEEQSWQRFCEEGIKRFLEGGYAGDYETELIAEFEAVLPDTPPWKR
jgi:phosphoglycolate phosphatase-like HAD superfamily hydrolase